MANQTVTKELGYVVSQLTHLNVTKQLGYIISQDCDKIAFADGDFIIIGCALVKVLSKIDSTHYNVRILGDLDEFVIPNSGGVVREILPSEWVYTHGVQVVSGLDHLEGMVVYALADGEVLGPFTVTDGAVDLGSVVGTVVVGLTYEQQVKTLYLTTDGIQPGGTDQGKRKLITGTTLRVDCSKGLSVGPDFGSLTTLVPPLPFSSTDLYTGDIRAPIFPTWDTRGEICIQQSSPLPAQVLGVIVEVTPGDTGR